MIRINGKVIEKNAFPDGTLRVQAIDIPEDTNVIVFTWNYEDDSELFMLQALVDKYEDYAQILVMPYIPHARMDRVKNAEDVFTLKSFCKIINSMNFKAVHVLDPHSDVSTALLDRVVVINGVEWVQAIIENKMVSILPEDEDFVFFYPDAGAAKRYSTDKVYTYGIKKRNWETGKIESLEIADPNVVKDKTVFIVDDICSYGGTFSRAAAVLKEAGAKDIILFVSHCEYNIFKGSVFTDGNIKAVITTNSIINPDNIDSEYDGKFFIANIF